MHPSNVLSCNDTVDVVVLERFARPLRLPLFLETFHSRPREQALN